MTRTAHAQTAPTPITSTVAAPTLPEGPALTNEPKPTSSIASSLPLRNINHRRTARTLVMSVPVVAGQNPAAASGQPDSVVLPTVSATPTAVPIAVAPKKPAVTAIRPLPIGGKAIEGTLSAIKPPVSPALMPLTAPSRLTVSPEAGRPAMRLSANLPARGGPIFSGPTGPIDLVPNKPVSDSPDSEAPVVTDSQRLQLARLDSDLALAQKRLNRAESRLTDGQRQLGNFTNVLQSAILEAGDDARGLHPFVRVAQRYLGTPYVWGGESARGFDCSGFIMRVMRDLGYKALPHSAAEQFHYGTPIAKALLKPGDVVFFANTYKPGISHVGIYLGKGRFIHAANSHVGTIVSYLSEPKWVEKYAGARRLIRLDS